MRGTLRRLGGAVAGVSAAAVVASTLLLSPATPAVARQGEPVRTLTIMAMDYSFSAPSSAPAGPTRIELMNQGVESHQAALVRLEPGRTMTDYLAALAQGFPQAARVGTFVAGPNGAEPGASASVTTDLRPGHYLVLCLIPAPDGLPHVVKGMSAELDVVGTAKPAPKPTGAPVVHLREFEFGVPKRFVEAVAQGAPIEVVNDGQQAHELVVSRLDDGVELADVIERSGEKGSPQTTSVPLQTDIAGATMLAPGARTQLRLDLDPGRYALLCFLPDDHGGPAHLHQGMAYPFTIG